MITLLQDTVVLDDVDQAQAHVLSAPVAWTFDDVARGMRYAGCRLLRCTVKKGSTWNAPQRWRFVFAYAEKMPLDSARALEVPLSHYFPVDAAA